MCSETSEAVGTTWEHAQLEFRKFLKIRITLLVEENYPANTLQGKVLLEKKFAKIEAKANEIETQKREVEKEQREVREILLKMKEEKERKV